VMDFSIASAEPRALPSNILS